MSTNDYVVIILGLLGMATVICIFKTKTPGFGRYTTSALLLTLVLFITAILLAAGKLDSGMVTNIFFAIVGFAGGLVTNKKLDA